MCYNLEEKGRGILISLDKVKGVGPRTKMLFGKLGIESVDDLVSHFEHRQRL